MILIKPSKDLTMSYKILVITLILKRRNGKKIWLHPSLYFTKVATWWYQIISNRY